MESIALQAEAANRACVYFCPNCRSRGIEAQEQKQFIDDYRRELPLMKMGTLDDSGTQIKEETETSATTDECNQLYSIVQREFSNTMLHFHKSSTPRPPIPEIAADERVVV